MKKIIYLFLIISSYSTAEGQWLPDIWFTNSNGYNSFSRNVAAGNNIVHVVWHDYRLSTWEIYYKRSIDNGLNWGSDTRLTFNAGQSDNPSIFANGLNVYLVWHDNSNGYFEIYFKKSTDGGISWSSDLRISNSNYNTVNLHPSLFVSGSFIHVVWHDLRDGNREIYYNRSTDNGINWGTDTRLTNNSAESEIATISGSGSTVNVSWKDNRDGNFEIYQKLSTNNGINWSSDYRLTNYPGVSQSPSISASGSDVFLVWDDNRFGNTQIFYKKSTDGGLNWGSELEFSSNIVGSVRPSIISSGSKIHVTWYEENTQRIIYKYSSNSGISWNPNTNLTTTASGYCGCTGPSINAGEQAVHIVWTAAARIYYKGNPSQNSSYINLNSPNGEEHFLSGSIQNITWITNISSNIKLELTTNNGNSWSIITSSYPADSGRYSWTVPNISSTQCKIKISDSNDPSLFDISESSFTISPVTFNTGLIAYYPFNGNVNDESGNNNHGTNFGATLTSDKNGITDKAYYFNGVDNYVSVPDLDFTNFEGLTWHSLIYPERFNDEIAVYYGYYGQIVIQVLNNKIYCGISLEDQIWYKVNIDTSGVRWYSVVGVWEKGNSLKMYIDGELKAQISVPNLSIGPRPLNHSSIGAYNRFIAEPRPYQGKIDEIRIYNRALSSVEIQNLYGQSVDFSLTMPNGGESWQSGTTKEITWNPGATNLLRIEFTLNNGGTWSTLSSSYPADSGRFAWTVPNINSTQCKIKITDANNQSIYDVSDSTFTISPVTLNTGLVVHYPFDNNFNDATGNGLNATPNGSPTFTQGVIGNSVNLIGDQNNCTYYSGGDRIRTPIFDFLSMNSFTISFWVYDTEILCGAETYFFQGDDWSPNRYIGIWHFYEYIAFSVGSYAQQQNQNFFVPFRETDRNRFVLYTMTYSNGALKAYRDSEYLGHFIQTVGYSSHYSGLASHGWFSGGASSARFVGKMDDFRIYNRELSQNEIQQLYNQSAPITISSPTSGENLIPQTIKYINWNASSNISNVKIEFSSNNGTNWNTLSNSFPAYNNSYQWTVSNANSTQCKIRISNTANSSINAESGVFTITQNNSTQLFSFKIKDPTSASKKIRLKFSNILNQTPFFKDASISNGLCTFNKSDLQILFSILGNSKIDKVQLLDINNDLVGYINIDYKLEDFLSSRKVEAILYVDEKTAFDVGYNPRIYTNDWNYFSSPTEKLVYMLIPPNGKFSDIRYTQQPLIFVHGIYGTLPYWGSKPFEIYPSHDGWQLYFPYDMRIRDCSYILKKAIEKILSGEPTGSPSYTNQFINIAAHSMGGLVSRYYIQNNSDQKVNKLLMLATPNNGALISYRSKVNELATGTLGDFFGKDLKSPAHIDLSPASDLLIYLKSSPIKQLSNRENKKSYLVIAGTSPIHFLNNTIVHHESYKQEDGVVAVSSASLLDLGIPLATKSHEHRELHTNISTTAISSFFNELYDPSDINNQVISNVDGFYLTRESIIKEDTNANFIKTKGILLLTIRSSHFFPVKTKNGQAAYFFEINSFPSLFSVESFQPISCLMCLSNVRS